MKFTGTKVDFPDTSVTFENLNENFDLQENEDIALKKRGGEQYVIRCRSQTVPKCNKRIQDFIF